MQILTELWDTSRWIFHIFSLFIFSSCLASIPPSYIGNHSFIFISGWPQSGTSLVHQFLNVHNEVSSMIENCERRLGPKHCISFNHEGQWVLSPYSREIYKSGQICRIDEVEFVKGLSIVREWGTFWSTNKPVLIEKSPQSFLKINMLHKLFQNSTGVKFLIILKHPATLNVATPKISGWRYYRDSSQPLKGGMSDAKKEISKSQMEENAKFFSDFMSISNSSIEQNCFVGWLPALNELFNLLNNSNFTKSTVRIVRHEQFSRPIPLCLGIMNFLFNGGMTADFENKQFCSNMFGHKYVVANDFSRDRIIAPLLDRRHKRYSSTRQLDATEGQNNITDDKRRQLRLRGAERGFQFFPELVSQRGRERLSEFLYSYNFLPDYAKKKLDSIDQQMTKFGYSMKQFGFHPERSIFRDWEI